MEVCNSGNRFIMCPICDICSYWNYSSICVTYKAGLLFDNGGTVFLSVFMSLWAVTFLEYWKRTCSTLSHRWDCSEFEDSEERPRPEFTAMAPMTMRNPVTGIEEPYFPENKRINRTLTGCMVIIIMVVVVLMFLIAIILYRTILSIIIYKSHNSFLSFSAGRIASLSGSVLNLLVILMLSRVYTSLAHILTRWEMHRTQTKYEDMFILKVFIFQFVNFYSSPVYIAFFKGRKLMAWWQKRKVSPRLKEEKEEREEVQRVVKEMEEEEEVVKKDTKEAEEEVFPWEADYQLLVCEGLFSEYLEMVIQFGFITIFVAACPLAPLFALVNNWVELRLDAQKFVTEYRRPVVERAQDIGIWFPILQFITHVAVLSNAFLIAFTSSFLPRLYYRYTTDSSLSGFVNFTLATSSHNYTQQHQNTSCSYMKTQPAGRQHHYNCSNINMHPAGMQHHYNYSNIKGILQIGNISTQLHPAIRKHTLQVGNITTTTTSKHILRVGNITTATATSKTSCRQATLPQLQQHQRHPAVTQHYHNYSNTETHPAGRQHLHTTTPSYMKTQPAGRQHHHNYSNIKAILQHVVFFIGRLIDMMVPDIPEELEMKIKREHYMAKEALADNQSLMKMMIPGEDVQSSELRKRGSRSSPPQSDTPPPPPPPTKPEGGP
ncbi:hypothetical protein PAMA_019990 [Pampus argenteus]